ncbi:MAG TPA: hypothetical protein VG603_10215, partial [Chitinophagales bacterium]|nr:hypothetical protein [Chitinophagales bacterium]
MKKVMLMALAAFFVTAAFAQTIDDAQNEINNENYYKARVILNKLLKDPASDKAQVEYYMGNAYLKDDEADSAKMFYKMVNTGDSKNPLGYLAAGRLGVLAKNSTEAKMNFDRAAQVTKFKNANVFFETGDAYFRPQIFDLAAAIQNLEKANELDGKNTTIMMELGDAYLENSSNDPTMGGKAMTEYENAIAINNKL